MVEKASKVKLSLLNAKQQQLFNFTQGVFNSIAPCNVDKSKRFQFLSSSATIDDVYDQFKRVTEEIEELKLTDNPDYVPNFQALDAFMSPYGSIKYHIKKFDSKDAQNPVVSFDTPKLPPLDLSSFNGDVSQWPSFYAGFKSMIHENKSLSNDHKVQYLVSKLKDQALSVTAGLPLVGSNYDIIWNALVERYQDVRYLAGHYMDNVINFKPIKDATKSEYCNFIDKLGSSVSALLSLKIENLHEFILYALSIRKLDSEMGKKFEAEILHDKTLPKFSRLVDFVKDQIRVMERTENSHPTYFKSTSSPKSMNHIFKKSSIKPLSMLTTKKESSQCQVCKKGSHLLFQCTEFNNMDPFARLNTVKSLKLCFNCFSPSHSAIACTNKNVCKLCKYKHHTLLHLKTYVKSQAQEDPVSQDVPALPKSQEKESKSVSATAISKNMSINYTVLLSTVKVNVIDVHGHAQTVRMLMDSGSMSHFITSKCCLKLGLKFNKTSVSVGGIGSIQSTVQGVTSFRFQSRFDSEKKFKINQAFVVDKITDKLPVCHIDTSSFSRFQELNLSDDQFHIPGEIEGLIGAELFAHIYGNQSKVLDYNNGPIVIKSQLGDIIMGKVPILSSSIREVQSLCTFVEPPLESLVQKFWTLEEVPTTKILSSEDEECEELFCKSVVRNEDGRYSVALPFKTDPNLMGDSYNIAKKRFFSLERKLSSNSELKEQYKSAIQEYFKEGFASLSMHEFPEFIMPHHAVYRPDKSTTKVRVVFDLSCRTSNGMSLNDMMYTGPTLYNDLFALLVNFRIFPVACTADVKKMFLQIYVHEEDRKYQRFLWRNSPNEELACYEMERVVFGNKASPYLSQRIFHKIADDEKSRFPKASDELKTRFYMDDYLNSFCDEEEAENTLSQCSSMLKSGGFELTKFASNKKNILGAIPEALRLLSSVEWDSSSSFKVLGIQWNPVEDNFSFSVNIQDLKCTKRNILSVTARIFDVLGLVSPVTICAKLLIKELWIQKIDWDEDPPQRFKDQWSRFIQELPLLRNFQVPRHLSIEKDSELSIIGFCDASERAMGACVYVHVKINYQDIVARLVCARSKVCPTKYVTIPRLELCASLLLAKLVSFIFNTLKSRHVVKQVLCFSDSTVALSWIASQPLRWKTFVANRVSKIQELVSPEKWFHVSGVENPSDCLSRGISPKELLDHHLWLSGPPWLSLPINKWKLVHISESQLDKSKYDDKFFEEKVTVLLSSNAQPSKNILINMSERISKWNILLRSIVYVLKFCHMLPKGDISVQDLHFAEIKLIQELQNDAFGTDIRSLQKNKPVSNSLLKLNPFMKDNLLLCGGRIGNAPQIGYHHAHPIILPKKHHVVNLLIDYEHQKNLHTGPQLLLSILRKKYWVLGGRDIVRQRIMKCVTCFKRNPKTIQPKMADLPACRVQETKSFYSTGIDYAGPFNVTISKRRGIRSQKAYLCLFICMSTKAVHLELASSLSTEAFLAALRRFLARRGTVKSIHCDNGTNFVGASNVLNELYTFLSSQSFKDAYQKELLDQRIEFKFNPPSSPHFGGLWESNVRAVKSHLYKVIGVQVLTYEELNTVLVEVEAILNSRPLCTLDSDSSAPQVLTPSHFLLQQPVQVVPIRGDLGVPMNLSQRFNLVNHMVQTYWKRFSTEYLSQLQERQKWLKDDIRLKPGLLVLIKNENSPVLHWPLGKIVDVYPGRDGVSRVARVQTKGGELTRPAVKLCPLPNQDF